MVEVNGEKFYPGQGNNAYIFPGVAFGAILAGLHHIPDAMFLKASQVHSSIHSLVPSISAYQFKNFEQFFHRKIRGST